MQFNLDHFIRIGSVICCIIFFFSLLLIKWKKKQNQNLGDLITVAFAGNSVPTGLALVYCAFDPALITELTDSANYIAIAGLSLIYIALATFKEKL